MAKRKTYRFHRWKWALSTYELHIRLGCTSEKAMKTVVALMPTYSDSWMDKCEGKTKSQMKKMGWAYADDWFVEE